VLLALTEELAATSGRIPEYVVGIRAARPGSVAIGTGFIARTTDTVDYVVTAEHVIRAARRITVCTGGAAPAGACAVALTPSISRTTPPTAISAASAAHRSSHSTQGWSSE